MVWQPDTESGVRYFGEYFDDLLRILVDTDENGGVWGVLKSSTFVTQTPVLIEQKIAEEVRRWIRAMGTAQCSIEHLKNLSPALCELYSRRDERALARTLRTLLAFEALFIDTPPKNCIDVHRLYPEIVELKATIVCAELPGTNSSEVPLRDVIAYLRQKHARISKECPWRVSLALLILVAVAGSQCECFRQVFWEGYSAIRTAHELQRKWSSYLPEVFLDVVRFLILHQSAAGQCVRGSGSKRFLEDCRRLTRSMDKHRREHNLARDECFTKRDLELAMVIMGILEDARTHRCGEKEELIGDIPVNAALPAVEAHKRFLLVPEECSEIPGVPQAVLKNAYDRLGELKGTVFRIEEDLRRQLENCLGDMPESVSMVGHCLEQSHLSLPRYVRALFETLFYRYPERRYSQYTWSYAASLPLADSSVQEFKHFIESNHSHLLTSSRVSSRRIVAFSFRRGQTGTKLGRVLAKEVEKVIAEKDVRERLRVFKKSFYLSDIVVPAFGDNADFHVVEVLLSDHIAAETLLFHESPPPPPQDGIGDSAGALAVHLFDHASTVFSLKDDSLAAEDHLYVPLPLMNRILKITYQLRAGTCRLVRVAFDDALPVSIPIPCGIPKTHRKLIECMADYVPAFVLSRAMAKGFKSCDISLDNLGLDSGKSASIPSDQMDAGDWQREIARAFESEAYDVLLDRYLRDYNTERKTFQLREHLHGPKGALPVNCLLSRLGEYLRHTGPVAVHGGRRPFIILGIDVGGTFTKFQFYQYHEDIADADPPQIRPLGLPFRMRTPIRQTESPRSDGNRADAGRTAVDFAERIVAVVTNNVMADSSLSEVEAIRKGDVQAIGVSWPGPVRAGRIAGTSGILAGFSGFSRLIRENDIGNIMALDIVGALRSAWQNRYRRNHVPVVAFGNDGTAEGFGVVMTLIQEHKDQVDQTRPLFAESLAVVKLGTGTAGAIFVAGALADGLGEWGKMPLDLPAVKGGPFPIGIANKYLSAKTLPALIGLRAKAMPTNDGQVLFRVDELSSAEIGLLLDMEAGDFTAPTIEALIRECGVMEYTMFHLGGEHSEQALKQIMDMGEQREPELAYFIRKQRHDFKPDMVSRLKKSVLGHGRARLSKILCLPPHTELKRSDRKKPYWKNVEIACKLAGDCAKTLGNYLGDFIVSLHDIYGISIVLVGGGVLSGENGRRIREQAVQRIRMYDSFKAQVNGSAIRLTEGAPVAVAQGGGDYGMLGAAVLAVNEFLMTCKSKGLQMIEARVLRLRIGETFQVKRTPDATIVFRGAASGQDDVLPLAKYSLEGDEVIEWLGTQRAALDIYLADLDDDCAKYCRF